MAHQRAHVVLPEALVAEIDALVGQRRRSAFLAEVASREVRRRRLLQFLDSEPPTWSDADHPDIKAAGGVGAWVRKLRREADRASRKRTERARR